jgi:hypothetical protein
MRLNIQQWFQAIERPQQQWGWLIFSLCLPLYFGGLTLLHQATAYIVQDDARQHVVYLKRLLDPQQFPNDLIADYFTAVAPVGYKAVYWAAAQFGIAPLMLAKLLPILLGLIATAYLFFTCLSIFPVPLSGWLTALVFNQQIWLKGDLVSATPRAFVYPIFAAFLYYLIRKSPIPCCFTILLQGAFFPQLVLIQAGVLALRWRHSPRFCTAGLLTAGLVMGAYATAISDFGPAITAAQMRQMPEYGLGGRNEYFGVTPIAFWLLGNSGLRIPVFPSIIWVGFGLPLLRFTKLTKRIEAAILTQVLLASLALYSLAHLLLLRLHFPSRYTYHTLRIILSAAAGICLTILLEAGWRKLHSADLSVNLSQWQSRVVLSLTAIFAAAVLIVPAVPALFLQFQGWVVGESPAIYQYLSSQPSGQMVASLAQAANSIPAFTGQSTLVGREFALPHHPQYYAQFIRRTELLVQFQYSASPTELISALNRLQDYGVDFWLIERNAFTPEYLIEQDWLFHSALQDAVSRIIDHLQQGERPMIQTMLEGNLLERCLATSTDRLIVLKTGCIQQVSSHLPG